MNRQILPVLTVLCLGSAACSDGGPTAPAADSELTTLAIEPNAPLAAGDPTGLVILSVWPQEDGGLISIEICVNGDGDAVAAEPSRDRTCEEQGGTWTGARDVEGTSWTARAWPGYATVRFDRQSGQAPMLFRTTYEAPAGGTTRSVLGCRWMLAEGSDVGVACSSEAEFRVLPSVLGEGISGGD